MCRRRCGRWKRWASPIGGSMPAAIGAGWIRRPTAPSTRMARSRPWSTATPWSGESDAIVRYLAARYAAGTLWPEAPEARAAADQWMAWTAASLYPDWIALFWKLVRKPPDKRDPKAIARHLAAAARAFVKLDFHLKNNVYLAGNKFTMADIPAGMMLYRWFEMDISRPENAACRGVVRPSAGAARVPQGDLHPVRRSDGQGEFLAGQAPSCRITKQKQVESFRQVCRGRLSPSPSHGFAAGPSLSPGRGNPSTARNSLLRGEREGPAKREGEGESRPRQTWRRLPACFWFVTQQG